MIIKYGTSEAAEVVETKNIPSWVTRDLPKSEQDDGTDTDDNTEEKE